jgi:hypothetical protein
MDAKKEDIAIQKTPAASQVAAPAGADGVEARMRTGPRHPAQPATRSRSEAAGAAPRTNKLVRDPAGTPRSLQANRSTFVPAAVVEIARAGDAEHPMAEATTKAAPEAIDLTGAQTVPVTGAVREELAEAATEAVVHQTNAVTEQRDVPSIDAAREVLAQVVPETFDQVTNVAEAHLMPARDEAPVVGRPQEAIAVAQSRAEYIIVTKRTTSGAGDRSRETSRTVIDAWAVGAEASFRAALNVQTATLSAGLALLEATNAAYREVAGQWSALVRQSQTTALVAWLSNLRSVGLAASTQGEGRR